MADAIEQDRLIHVYGGGGHTTLVMGEHDMGVVFNLADKISVLVYGEIIASGAPTEIRGNAAVKEAYLGEEAA